jgi:NhaP-type Na+/H+ or K+/H+ antiporter
MARRLDASALRDWAHAAVGDLISHTDEINRLNVFPVADADTGTNMLFTMRSAWAQADAAADSADVAQVAAALADGALHGARGNSGVILSQILRGLADVTAAAAADRDFVWWEFVIQDVGVGLLTGLIVAFVAAQLMPQERALGYKISPHQKSMYALGVAFAAYGIATLPPDGNGFIAVFVCAIALGIWRPDIRHCFEDRAEDIIEVVKLGVFLVFGAIFTFDTLFEDGWSTAAIAVFTLLAARPIAVFVALAGNHEVDTAGKAFMAWFGPKGVATMTFALFVLGSTVPDGEQIAVIAAVTVFFSIIAHGLTDQPGAEWIGRREQSVPEPAEAAP